MRNELIKTALAFLVFIAIISGTSKYIDKQNEVEINEVKSFLANYSKIEKKYNVSFNIEDESGIVIVMCNNVKSCDKSMIFDTLTISREKNDNIHFIFQNPYISKNKPDTGMWSKVEMYDSYFINYEGLSDCYLKDNGYIINNEIKQIGGIFDYEQMYQLSICNGVDSEEVYVSESFYSSYLEGDISYYKKDI